jgi:hypothetical protein
MNMIQWDKIVERIRGEAAVGLCAETYCEGEAQEDIVGCLVGALAMDPVTRLIDIGQMDEALMRQYGIQYHQQVVLVNMNDKGVTSAAQAADQDYNEDRWDGVGPAPSFAPANETRFQRHARVLATLQDPSFRAYVEATDA